MIDLIIVNLAYFVVMIWSGIDSQASSQLYGRPMWLVLNVAMVVCIYFFSEVHERRVIYADKVVGQALKLVLTHAGIFITLTTFLGAYDEASWRQVLAFYAIFFLALATWWVLSRQLVRFYFRE